MGIESNDSDISLGKNATEEKTTLNKPETIIGRLMRRSSFFGGGDEADGSPEEFRKETMGKKESSLPPLSSLKLSGYKESTRRRLLDEELAEDIRGLLPARLQLFDEWELVYSLEQHGISLGTLYQKCNLKNQLQAHRKRKEEVGYGESVIKGIIGTTAPQVSTRPHGYILVIKDEHNDKFGAYLNEELKPVEHRRYYGNGECFLWKSENRPEEAKGDVHNAKHHSKHKSTFKAFVYTGMNDNIIYSNHDYFAIGSSNGQNGLWIDSSLYNGVSCPCETFGNEILCKHEKGAKVGRFKVMGLELWRVGSLE